MVLINKRRFLQVSAIGGGAAALLAAGVTPLKAADKRYTVGLAMNSTGHPFSVRMMTGNRQFATAHYPEIDLLITDGSSDAIKQTQDVESLLARGIDALMISPYSNDALTPVVKRVMDKGIPVVTLDRTVNTPVTCKIGANNRLIGVEVGKFVANKHGADARIIELQGTAGASATVERGDGFREGLNGQGKIIASQNCDYVRAPAVAYTENMTSRFAKGEFNVLYAHNDAMALGALQVLRERDRLDGVDIVSIDGENAAFEEVAAGAITGCWIYPPCAPEGIQAVHAILSKQPYEPIWVLKTTEVTIKNVQDFIGKGI